MHYDVIIATPGSGVEAKYLTSLMDTVELLHKKNISFKFINAYSSIVSEARNNTVYDTTIGGETILNGQYTYNKIFWIDSDMGWKAEDFLKLYEADYDIISGACVRGDGVLAFHTHGDMSEHVLMKFSRPFSVASVGFAFICLASGVMESTQYPWFRTQYDFDENGKSTLLGEDVFFCKQAIAAGYQIHVDPTVRIDHYKTMSLTYRDVNIIADQEEDYEKATNDFLKEFLF